MSRKENAYESENNENGIICQQILQLIQKNKKYCFLL